MVRRGGQSNVLAVRTASQEQVRRYIFVLYSHNLYYDKYNHRFGCSGTSASQAAEPAIRFLPQACCSIA